MEVAGNMTVAELSATRGSFAQLCKRHTPWEEKREWGGRCEDENYSHYRKSNTYKISCMWTSTSRAPYFLPHKPWRSRSCGKFDCEEQSRMHDLPYCW